jgi:hypothetical protein
MFVGSVMFTEMVNMPLVIFPFAGKKIAGVCAPIATETKQKRKIRM